MSEIVISEADCKFYHHAVKAGVELLNKKKPGWIDDIDLGELEMCSACGCILGQAFGAYYEALEDLRIPGGGQNVFGFTIAYDLMGFGVYPGHVVRDVHWKLLGEIWTEAITSLRAEASGRSSNASQ